MRENVILTICSLGLLALSILIAFFGVRSYVARHHPPWLVPPTNVSSSVAVSGTDGKARPGNESLTMALLQSQLAETIVSSWNTTRWGVTITSHARFTRIGDMRYLQVSTERAYIPPSDEVMTTSMGFNFWYAGLREQDKPYVESTIRRSYVVLIDDEPLAGMASFWMDDGWTALVAQARPRVIAMNSLVNYWGSGSFTNETLGGKWFEIPFLFFSWTPIVPSLQD